jgi:hypothetical protein
VAIPHTPQGVRLQSREEVGFQAVASLFLVVTAVVATVEVSGSVQAAPQMVVEQVFSL